MVFVNHNYNGNWKVKNESLLGFSLSYDILPVIFIKKTSPSRQTFTLMHELGHLLLGHRSKIDYDSDIHNPQAKSEVPANLFAGMVLVPDTFLLSSSIESVPQDATELEGHFHTLSERLGVSTEVILRRLLEKSLLSQQLYIDYRHWDARKQERKTISQPISRKYRYREPVKLFGEPYVRKMLHALNHKRITLNKASNFLDNLSIQDIQKLEQHLFRQSR